MGLYENMPFARGCTYYGSLAGGAVTPTLDDTSAQNLVGREYIHEDYTYGTGMWVKVRICRNDSGGYLQGGRLCRFNNFSQAFGNAYTGGASTISTATSLAPLWGLGYASVQGFSALGTSSFTGPEKTAVIDDLLPNNTYVAPYDLFYVVVSGPCLAFASLAAADYTNGQSVSGISVGDLLCAATGVGSGATTAGTTAGTTGITTHSLTSGRFATAYFGLTASTANLTVAPGTSLNSGLAATGAAGLFNQFTNIVGRAISACSSAYITAASTSGASGANTGTGGATYKPLLIQAGFGLWE